MAVEITVPEVGESIQEVQILRWMKHEGDRVEKDEDVVEIETDKATVAIPSPAAGRLDEILKNDGDFAEVGDVIARLVKSQEDSGEEEASREAEQGEQEKQPEEEAPPAKEGERAEAEPQHRQQPAEAQQASKPRRPEPRGKEEGKEEREEAPDGQAEAETSRRPEHAPPKKTEPAAPAKQKRQEPSADRQTAVAQREPAQQDNGREPQRPVTERRPETAQRPSTDGREEETVPMSILRRTIARRLVEAQQNAALVTTFNEIDMQEAIDLRREFSDEFREHFDVKLGYMSLFVKAAVEALKQFPEVNARVEGNDVVYRNYFDIGIAIGSDKGLVVPILRDCQRLSFAEIERRIDDFVARAKAGQLEPEELEGGTFTITNGGIYGSLLSTPIVNPPQSGVLGMHAILERPVAREGRVLIRPMMYVALTYDHRIVDGREAVGFLKRICEIVESPARLLLEV